MRRPKRTQWGRGWYGAACNSGPIGGQEWSLVPSAKLAQSAQFEQAESRFKGLIDRFGHWEVRLRDLSPFIFEMPGDSRFGCIDVDLALARLPQLVQ